MKRNRKYQAQLERISYQIAEKIRECGRELYTNGGFEHYSGDPFLAGGGVWPRFAFAVLLNDGVPALTIIQCLEVGGQPQWFDAYRMGIHCPNRLGLVGFWDATRDHNMILETFFREDECTGDDGGAESNGEDYHAVVELARALTPVLGNFVVFTGDGWKSEIGIDCMLDRIEAVVDQLLGGKLVKNRTGH